jgi:hypothetical protein
MKTQNNTHDPKREWWYVRLVDGFVAWDRTLRLYYITRDPKDAVHFQSREMAELVCSSLLTAVVRDSVELEPDVAHFRSLSEGELRELVSERTIGPGPVNPTG